ncbi:MAG: MJ0042-type zinc finger domain-containing protein [Devosia sp.]
MSSPDLQTAVIACPHCGTRYQVPHATLGAAGREVQCAQCGKSWHARAEAPASDAMFTPEEEHALDTAFEAEQRQLAPPAPVRDPEHERTLAQIRAAIAPRPKLVPPPSDSASSLDPALEKQSRRALEERLATVRQGLPLARLRRGARTAALVVLVLLLGIGLLGRVEIVRAFPQLAGIYAAVGLGVNIVGLEFTGTKTLMSLRDGKSVMQVDTTIRSVSSDIVAVPPVLVTLLDATGGVLFEWTVIPKIREMEPGEMLEFSTELNTPPEGAATVRLSFTNGRGDSGFSSRVD